MQILTRIKVSQKMEEHNNSITSILQKSALHLLNQTVGRLKHIYKKLTKYLIINHL